MFICDYYASTINYSCFISVLIIDDNQIRFWLVRACHVIVILISDWSVDGQMGTMGRKCIWNISYTMISWSVIIIWSNCSTDCGVRTMRVTAALSDQYPAHNIQIFSHRFSPEFCISFKHKLITSALPVHSFLFAPLLQCCGILLKLLTMEQSFRDWNETLHMISFLTTFTSLLASSCSPHSIFSWWRMCNIVDSRILRG